MFWWSFYDVARSIGELFMTEHGVAAATPPRRASRPSQQAPRHTRWQNTLRIFTAVVGGYAFANTASILLSTALPVFRGEAVVIGFLLTYVFYTVAIMWVFGDSNWKRSCAGVWLLSLLFGGIHWLVMQLGAAA